MPENFTHRLSSRLLEPAGWVKSCSRAIRRIAFGLAVVIALGHMPNAAHAQVSAPQAGQAAKPSGPPWSSRCSAAARGGPLECQMEQRAVVTETGRLLILLTIRVPAETRKPVLAIQAPNSIYLPAGVTIDIDGDQKAKLEFQMCDGNGCYAAAPIADDLKQAMFKGLKMNVAFQNLNKREFKVPMSLSSFTDVYNSIQ